MSIAGTTVHWIYADARKKTGRCACLGTSSANRERGFYTLQRKQRSLRVRKLLSAINPSDARKTERR